MHVVIIHPRWQVGSVERTNIQWVKVLMWNGVRNISIFTNGAAKFAPNSVPNGVAIKICSGGDLALILRAMRESGPDTTLIFCQSYLLPKVVIAKIITPSFRGRMVLAERNSIDQFSKYPIKKTAFQFSGPLLRRLFDRIIVNSAEILHDRPYRNISNVVAVSNPRFDQEHVEWLSKGAERKYKPNKFVFIGRWDRQKGIDTALEVAIHSKPYNISIDIFAGVTTHNAQSRLHRYLEDPMRFMSENDVALIFLSRLEGYPNILLEARSIGVPIIYKRCKSGVSEIMEGYANGVELRTVNAKQIAKTLVTVSKRRFTVRPDIDFARSHTVERSELFSALT